METCLGLVYIFPKRNIYPFQRISPTSSVLTLSHYFWSQGLGWGELRAWGCGQSSGEEEYESVTRRGHERKVGESSQRVKEAADQ